ncbi:hypothetical protein [Aliiruegeria lutimaris]|uniref:Beta-barrel porin 2 n=1 Tax=Aliiruegeria lutimaris TaxID=571298 RepID=A0A1G8R5V8_9RHOB|nr:hypothetical protein [Aliiruegeria lutimaris]SDJ12361.1 hypothetical protein SAMN04488026_101267 [Aliiruegeria lutimaris]
MGATRHPELLAGLLALAMVAAPACAVTVQEDASDFYFDVGSGLEINDNYESLEDPLGTTSLWVTDFALGYETETRREKFSFKTGARFELGDFAEDPDRTSQWINPFATLRYRREGSGSFFRTKLDYRERDNGIDLDRDFDSSTDLVVDQGTRRDTEAKIEMAVGLESPTWAKAELAYHQRRFSDTTDPDLTDRDTFRVEGELGFALTRTSSLLLVAGYRERDVIDDLDDDEEHSSVGAGLQSQLSPDLTLRALLRYERNELTSPASEGRETSVKESPTVDLSLVKDLRNGNLRFALKSDLDSNGVRTTARIGRKLDLQRGQMNFTVGATWLDDGRVTPVGAVKWERDYRTRQLSLDFNSAVYTDDDQNEALRNRLAFRLDQELTVQDGLRFDVSVLASDDLDGEGGDYRQAAASISYFRSIQSDLSLVTGYRHAFSDDGDNKNVVTENKVFVRIDKRFSLRP